MKTLNLLLTTGVLLVSSFIISVNAQTQSISLDPEEWSEGKNMDIYEEEGNLVLEVWTAAEPAWQETYIRIIDLDLEKYPNFSITTEGDEGAQWNVKIAAPDLPDQASLLTGSTAGGGDSSEFGEFNFEGTIPSILGEDSGEVSFELYLWVIGQGQRLVISDLHFYGDGGTGLNQAFNPTTLTNKPGGFVLNNVENKAITIFGSTGAIIKSIISANSKQDIDLPAGLYLVKIGEKTTKVIVN